MGALRGSASRLVRQQTKQKPPVHSSTYRRLLYVEGLWNQLISGEAVTESEALSRSLVLPRLSMTVMTRPRMLFSVVR